MLLFRAKNPNLDALTCPELKVHLQSQFRPVDHSPSLVPNATLAPQTGSLSLLDEQNFAPFMFLPLQLSDLAVSALVDSRAMHNFLGASLLPKPRDSLSFVSIVPCQLQVTLADGGVVQVANLVILAPEVVDEQGMMVPGIPALEFCILDMLPV